MLWFDPPKTLAREATEAAQLCIDHSTIVILQRCSRRIDTEIIDSASIQLTALVVLLGKVPTHRTVFTNPLITIMLC